MRPLFPGKWRTVRSRLVPRPFTLGAHRGPRWVIAGDVGKARLDKVCSVAERWGLSGVVWAETPIETVPISHLVSETEVSGLCLLPAGSCGGTPTNLFYSPRMTRLLKRLRKEFDMIMIDAPPMIHLADARVLGRLADGVILVVLAGQTTTESALFASQRFPERR